MQQLQILTSQLSGNLTIPSSKSHTLRAILFALLAKGKSIIHDYLPSPDTEAMLQAIIQLGAKVKQLPKKLEIEGCGGQLKPAENVIDAKNSGLVFRFITAITALLPSYTIITGDASIRYLRPISPLLNALKKLGAFAESSRLDGHAPVIIRGPIKPGSTTLSGEDSQPVSALLIATSMLAGPSNIQVKNPGEKPWIDLTLHWLKKFHIEVAHENYENYSLPGNASISNFETRIPGDFSSAAYPIVAALITNSELIIENIDMEDVQGDKKIIELLIQMGAHIEIDRKAHTLTVKKGSKLRGRKIDINPFIDAITILAVIGCFAEGTTEIFNGAIARQKECDRIQSIVCELKKMGAQIEEKKEGILIKRSSLKGALDLQSYSDHRMALSLSVAALAAQGKSTIAHTQSIVKTYPTFLNDFRKIGAAIEEC